MNQPQDEDAIKVLLGVNEIPEDVQEEYTIRLHMYHRANNSGPLGTIGLIDMLRSLGLRPPAKKPSTEVFDWRKCPTDGTFLIEVLFLNEWGPGRWRGFVDNGTMAVVLDVDPGHVREVPPYEVRPIGLEEEFEDEPDPPRAALLKVE